MIQARSIFENHHTMPNILAFNEDKNEYILNSTYSDAMDTGSALYQVLNAYNEKWSIWKTSWECSILCHVVVLPEAIMMNNTPMLSLDGVVSSLASANVEYIV